MRRPIDAMPQERAPRMIWTDGQAKVFGFTARIQSCERLLRAGRENMDSGCVVHAGRGSAGQREGPQEKIDHITHTAAQNRQGLEEQGDAAGNKHHRQIDQQEGRPQLPQRYWARFRTQPLHGQCSRHQHQHHGRQHSEVAHGFCDGIKHLRHGRGGQNPSYARRRIALHRILDNVEPAQRKKSRTADRHQHADPGRVVDAAITVTHDDRNFLSDHGVRHVQGARQDQQEAVAPHALEKICLRHVIENTQRMVHAAAPARCCERQNR